MSYKLVGFHKAWTHILSFLLTHYPPFLFPLPIILPFSLLRPLPSCIFYLFSCILLFFLFFFFELKDGKFLARFFMDTSFS